MKHLIAAIFLTTTLLLTNSSPVFAQTGECATLQCPFGFHRRPLVGSTCECMPDPAGTSILDKLDPLRQPGGNLLVADQLSTPGGIISRLMSFAFPLAGMILFVMILFGGFQMLAGGGDQKALEAGRQRVTFAIIGFLLLFSSYWIAQILETLLNIKIL